MKNLLLASTFLLVLVVLLSSCNKKNENFKVTSHQNKRTNKLFIAEIDTFSDEDVFKSVMFLDGPLTQFIGDYGNFSYHNLTNDSAEIASELVYETNIIDTIEKRYPDYMHKFRNNVLSGNYDSVFYSIKSTSQLIWNLTCTLTNSTNIQLENMCNQIIANFEQTTGYNSQDTSQSDILESVYDFDNSPDAHKNFFYEWKWVYVHTAAAVVFVVGLVLFIGPDGAINGGQTYFDQDYCSTITIDLSNK